MTTNSKEYQREYAKQYRAKKKQDKEKPKIEDVKEETKIEEVNEQIKVFKKKSPTKKKIIVDTHISDSDILSEETIIEKDDNQIFDEYIEQIVEQRIKERINNKIKVKEDKELLDRWNKEDKENKEKNKQPFFFQQERLLEMGQKCLEASIPILIPLLLRPLLMPRPSLPNSNISLPPRPMNTYTQNSNNSQTNTSQPILYQVPTLNI